VDDLASLEHLNEDILLKELQMRYSQDKIYVSLNIRPTYNCKTYVTDILVAVNPFKKLPFYDEEVCAALNDRGVDFQTLLKYNNVEPGQLPPHVFGVADAAYHNIDKMKRSQCIIIRSVLNAKS
jgi:myosin heavy subunit